MVLNDIIEQAAGRQSGASDHGGKPYALLEHPFHSPHFLLFHPTQFPYIFPSTESNL